MNRMSFAKVSPDGFRALRGLETYLDSVLDATVLEIVKVRASLINGCAFCLDLHIEKLVKLGMPQRKINMIGVWRETNFFTEDERAILALTEEATNIAGGVSDQTWQTAIDRFGDKVVADLLLAIGAINVWNRIQVSTHTHPPQL